jgi:hypothetical protein
MQVHYVNATTQQTPSGAEVVWNLFAEPDPSRITAHMGALGLSNVDLNIPPFSRPTFSTDCKLRQAFNLVAATGHFHSRGVEFDILTSADGIHFDSPPIYVSRDWTSAPFTIFTGPLALDGGSTVRYSCQYDNQTANTYLFGPHVDTQEHCIANLYMYPWDNLTNSDVCVK